VSAQQKSPKKLAVCLAIGRGATSFFSRPWLLKIKNTAQPRVVRRYDECASAKPDSGAAAAVAPGHSVVLGADRLRPGVHVVIS
jgi:hypothetical protein